MTATEALERRIDELCAENERLRQEGRDVGMVGYELGRKSMAAENKKLLELVRDMWMMQEALPYGAHIEIADRMRELGIEVDG